MKRALRLILKATAAAGLTATQGAAEPTTATENEGAISEELKAKGICLVVEVMEDVLKQYQQRFNVPVPAKRSSPAPGGVNGGEQ